MTERGDFDIAALHAALDERRRALGVTWEQAARAINAPFADLPTRGLSPSTLAGMRSRRTLEGDGVLQVLRWLERTPESFVPGGDAGAPLPALPRGRILRFDTKEVYAAISARRSARGMSWQRVADELGGLSGESLKRMAQGGRTGFPQIVRIAIWLGRPVASFTRAADR